MEDVVAIYAGDLAHVRDTLDSRYDDIKSGKVKLIPAKRFLNGCAGKAKPSDNSAANDRLSLPPGSRTDIDEIWEYIAADRVSDEIERALQNLAKSPDTGHRRSDRPAARYALSASEIT